MAIRAGKDSQLYTTGTPTAFSNEGTNRVTANTVYRITDAIKRILDPTQAIVVQVDADGGGAGGYVTAAESTYDVNYLDGRITFAADQGANAVVRVASGRYLPRLPIATCRATNVDLGYETGDATVYGNGAKALVGIMKTLNGSFEVVEDLLTDIDSGGAVLLTLSGILDAGAPVILEFWPGSTGNRLRAWVLLSKGSAKASSKDLVGATLTFEVAEQNGVASTVSNRRANFSWCLSY
jgi:hypothetical protein